MIIYYSIALILNLSWICEPKQISDLQKCWCGCKICTSNCKNC